jgi:hypothetical protein
MLRKTLIATVAVSALAPIALVPTEASAYTQPIIPYFHPSTIQMPRTLGQPNYGPPFRFVNPPARRPLFLPYR